MSAPTWYDLLDVAEDASTDDIRTAWRTAIADLDPGDRRFRSLSSAAEVLLDEEARAAYDAELAATRDAESAHIPAETAQIPDETAQIPAETAQIPAESADVPDDSTGKRDVSAGKPADSAGKRDVSAGGGRVVPAWLLGALAVVTAALLGVSGWLWLAVPSDAAVERGTEDAQAAAERALTTVLSYDYRHLDADQKAGQALLTSSYQEDYDSLYGVIREGAPATQPVVQASIVGSSITRSGAERVEVFVLVDQLTRNAQLAAAGQESVTYRNAVTVTMAYEDDAWLVDGLRTQPTGTAPQEGASPSADTSPSESPSASPSGS